MLIRFLKSQNLYHLNLKKLILFPASLHSNSVAFSLAMLVIYSYLDEYVNLENKDEILAPLHYTKLYWALQRMLEPETHRTGYNYYLISYCNI